MLRGRLVSSFVQVLCTCHWSLETSYLKLLQVALVIGSRLDADASAAACRLAFCGRLAALLSPEQDPRALAALRVFKPKQRYKDVFARQAFVSHALSTI